jgi:hypothetical protein
MIYLARRNPSLTEKEFAPAWRAHSALGRQCRNVQDKVVGVTQCTRLGMDGQMLDLRGVNQDYDGVNLLRLRDLGVATDIWNDPETRTIMRPDELRVFDRYVRDFTLVAQERVVHDGPLGEAILFAFIPRAPELALTDFLDALTLACTSLSLSPRVVLNAVEAERPPGFDFDAIIECWFADADAMQATIGQHDVRKQLAAAIGSLCQIEKAVLLATGVSHRRSS